MGKFIPLSIPNFEGNERKYVDDAIDQGWVSTGGAYITKLEKELAKLLYTPNVYIVNLNIEGNLKKVILKVKILIH